MLKKNLKITDFQTVVPWSIIEAELGKRRYKQFLKFMSGQTCIDGGAFPDDLDRFLRGQEIID